MIIRPLISQDKAKILCILQQKKTFNNSEIELAMELIEESLDHPEKKDYHVFCATDDGDRLAGYICFGPIPITEGCYDLYWIVVAEEYERRGIGGKLLEYMVQCVMREKGRRIYVDTSSTPPYASARSFYEKHGYMLVCSLRDFYRAGDHKMIFMKEVCGDNTEVNDGFSREKNERLTKSHNGSKLSCYQNQWRGRGSRPAAGNPFERKNS